MTTAAHAVVPNIDATKEDGHSSGGASSGFGEDSAAGSFGEAEQPNPTALAKRPSILRIGIGQIGVEGIGRNAASPVDRRLALLFRQLGHWIARWRLHLLLAILALTAICSASILWTPQQDDLKSGYTPKGARSKEELARYERHFGNDDQIISNGSNSNVEAEPISILVFIQARDNGSLLREALLEETVQLMDMLANEFPLGGRPFSQFCTDFCQLNEPVRQFMNGFLIRQHHLEGTVSDADRLNLSFPFMSLLGHRIDLSPHFFGAKLGPDGQLAHLRLILLQFKADAQRNVSRTEMLRWERQIVRFLHREYNGQLRPLVFTMGYVADEVVRTGMTLFPYLSVGFAIMCAFSAGTVALSGIYFGQCSRQKMLIAIVACCCPLLACASALGLLFWAGIRFGTILCVSPFLVLAIGVDDAFLMLQSWQRICCGPGQRNGPKNVEKVLEVRIGQMLEDVGPSITITSATNVLAFCIGILTPTPEIQLFCAGNALAIFFDYLYQLLLFTPCLAMAGKWEMTKPAPQSKQSNSPWQHQLRVRMRQSLSAFMRAYCRWVGSGFTAGLVLLCLLFYWLLSVNLALRVVPNITPRKLLLADSPLNEVVFLKDTYILPNYMPVSIFIENAAGFREQWRIERIKALVAEFELEPNNLGPEFTHFWLRDFEQYMHSELVEESEIADENMAQSNGSAKLDQFSRASMSAFLRWPEYRHWNGFLRFRDDGELERFFVITAFHGTELIEWNSRAQQLARWRAIVDKFPDLGAFVWVEEAQFLDQIETLVPATVQSSIATLLCMSLVCSLFMANIFTVVIATLSIVSICLGAFGLLVAWGIDLDPISMATTIMSIGFSVDFPAHLIYHYYRCRNANPQGTLLCPERSVQIALLAVGYPLLQCGLSTILFVLCLLFVDTYMSEVFVKSMFLVVSLGLLHGLFIVPAMLCALSNLNVRLKALKRFIFGKPNGVSSAANVRRRDSENVKKLERKGSSKLVVAIAGPG